MHLSGLLVLVTILIALSFDFINGFHDAANSIATVVSTRVLSPRWAVVWAAVFNFVAAFVFGTAVAKTISGGLIDPKQVTQYVILAALAGAIIWDLLTWWWGLPTSSSHALIGGLAGAGIARAGWQVLVREPKLHWPIIGTLPGLGEKWMSTLMFIVLAPFIGLIIGLALMVAVSWIFHRTAPRTVDKLFRKLQLLSAAAYSIGHGGNDAQKTMGIIAGALLAGGYLTQAQFAKGWGPYKWWIIVSANAAMGLGTYFGGWRIVRTMGSKITKLRPVGGFCAESAGAVTLFFLASHGIPVSTTHTITGAIVGVGSTTRLSAVRWGVAQRIVWAWVLTIPASAIVAALTFWIIRQFVPSA
ncbi:MAG TPA: inorganic phosphate transporter [Candidatus Angelobacter sp.]|nr:inorganic phosphate transporter [Candidatus Angelobacter sp.]